MNMSPRTSACIPLAPLLFPILFFSLIHLVGCGPKNNFSAGTASKKVPTTLNTASEKAATKGENPEQPSELSLEEVAMRFDCNASNPDVKTITIPPWDGQQEIPLKISGVLCDQRHLKRNILIVIDASASMLVNDPNIKGECGRLQAVRSLISNASPKKKFALITFSDSVMATSYNFSSNLGAVLADAAPGFTPTEVLCDSQAGTFYDRALERARTLVGDAPDADFTELYFISDGAPTMGHDGVSIANELKLEGVTIGTLMLQGQDMVLKNQIASQKDGNPLFFYASDAAKLEQSLADLVAQAEGYVEKATITIKLPEGDTQQSFDALAMAQNGQFIIPPHFISPTKYPKGLNIVYYYRLSDGHEVSLYGEVRW